jgi:ABC-type antimicrobial peptide transport system permease subunit
MLVTLFAAVALVITAAGIAGVVSFGVNQRTTEISVGWRSGATRERDRDDVRQGLAPVLAGLGVGLVGALLMTRVTRLLFAVDTDPATYAAVLATLAIVAALACLSPARRAAAIDLCARCVGVGRSKAQPYNSLNPACRASS